jgi:hypothetical protein
VTLAAKRIIAIATTADINPIVIAGETNDREDTLIMLRTKYRFQSKIRVPFGSCHKISIIRQFLTSMTNDSKKKDYAAYAKITTHPKQPLCVFMSVAYSYSFLLITKVLPTYPYL